VTLMRDEPAAIAARFLEARRQAAGLEDYPGQMPSSLDQAYAVQDRAIGAWKQRVIGWKVGRVPEPFSSKFGADRLAGPIFASTFASDGQFPPMPVFAEGFAAGEAEFLLRIGKAPAQGKTEFSLGETVEHIDAVHVGIEVASSPLKTINELGPVAIVSDFGNNNGLLIGSPVPNWRDSGFEQWPVSTFIDGKCVGTGSAASFADGAIGSARFLLQLMAKRGIALQPGQWISSGAVTGVHKAVPGQRIEAVFDDRLRVSCALVAATGDRAVRQL